MSQLELDPRRLDREGDLGMSQLELDLYQEVVNVHNMVDPRMDGQDGRPYVRYIGNAVKQNDGKYICLADVNGVLCRVEVALKEAK